jgi:hypothetical protein
VPLKSISKADAARIVGAIASGRESLVYVPFWSSSVRTTSAFTAGNVQAEGIPYGLVVGAEVIVSTFDGRKAIKCEVTGIVGGITLDPAPNPADFPAGSWISLAVLAFAEISSRSHRFDWSPSASISFQELQVTTSVPAVLPETYRGLWIFGEGEGYEFLVPRDSVGVDISSRTTLVGLPFQVRTRTLAEALEFHPSVSLLMLEPFHTSLVWAMQQALNGQLNPLWVRSYLDDFPVVSFDGALVTVTDYGQRPAIDNRPRYVFDRTSRTAHEIVDVQDGDPGEFVIELDTPIQSASPILEMLFLCRLGGDMITMQRSATIPRHWECNLTFIELPKEYADIEEES